MECMMCYAHQAVFRVTVTNLEGTLLDYMSVCETCSKAALDDLGLVPGKPVMPQGHGGRLSERPDDFACPGCGCMPGDGVTAGCAHPEGCGYFAEGSQR